MNGCDKWIDEWMHAMDGFDECMQWIRCMNVIMDGCDGYIDWLVYWLID